MLAVGGISPGGVTQDVVKYTTSPSLALDRRDILRRLSVLSALSADSESARVILTLSRSGVRLVLDQPGVKAVCRVTPVSITVNDPIQVAIPLQGLSAMLRGVLQPTVSLEVSPGEIVLKNGAYSSFVRCSSASAVVLPRLTSSQAYASSLICALFTATSLPDSLGISKVYVDSGAALKIVSAHPHILRVAESEPLGISFGIALSGTQANAIADLTKGREDLVHFGLADEWIVIGCGHDSLYLKQSDRPLLDYETELLDTASDIVCSTPEEFKSVSRQARRIGAQCVSMRPAGRGMSFSLRGREIRCDLPPNVAGEPSGMWANLDPRYLSAALSGADAIRPDSLVYHHPVSANSPVRLSARGEIRQFQTRYLAAIMPLEI